MAIVASAVLLGGCAASGRAPVVSRDSAPGAAAAREARPAGQVSGKVHTVVAGDTLYSIAWRYGLDYRDVAAWNGIKPPYLIVPRQVLKLQPAPGAVAGTDSTPGKPPAPAATVRSPVPQRTPRPAQPVPGGLIDWAWPTAGKLVRSDAPTSKKGIDIAGSAGQIIKAAATGHVVYSGSGLFGYGRLIIIKHNDAFLSAYAHNSSLMVKEGDHVTIGQQIATMGLGMSGRPVLHFEIRKDGHPVNPLEHLPRVSS